MSSEHIQTRHKLQEVCDVSSFEDLLNSCILTDDERELMNLHYLKGKDFRYIADSLGFSESTIKRKHRKILGKVGKLMK